VTLAYALPVWNEWAQRLLTLLRSHYVSPAVWSYYIQASEPLESLWMTWPVVVSLAVVLSGCTELLFASILAFTLLVGYDLFHAIFPFFSANSLARLGPLPRSTARVALTCGHLLRAFVTIDVIRRALKIALDARAQARAERLSESRPSAIYGRLAVVGSMVFAVFIVGAQGWSVFEEFGLRHTWLVRALADNPPRAFPRRRETPQERHARLLQDELAYAAGLMSEERMAEARRALIKAISAFESLAESIDEPTFFSRTRADALNNLAWLLATSPDESLRDPSRAVQFARKSLELEPNAGNSWNTLAVAHFRNQDFPASLKAFAEAMSLRGGGDAFDWFFLAMIAQREGRIAAAQAWFEKAVAFRENQLPAHPELHRFHTEAARSMGLDPPPPLVRIVRPRGPGRRSLPRAALSDPLSRRRLDLTAPVDSIARSTHFAPSPGPPLPPRATPKVPPAQSRP
jgi:tetratricopeptide (TPR) repeat protein